MSTDLANSSMFYTLDSSQATEASIKYTGNAVTLPSGVTSVNVVAAQTSDGSGNSAVIVQDGQTIWGHWKTVDGCTSMCPSYPDTPNPQHGGGVDGTPPAIYFWNPQTSTIPPGSPTTGNFNFSTADNEATSVLWPYNVSAGDAGSTTGCENCTALVEDFYLWPEYDSSANPSNVHEWESDLIAWNATTGQEPGASLQCNVNQGWQYLYQGGPTWQNLASDTNGDPITQDCVGNLPFGTLPNNGGPSGELTATATSFSVTPNGSNTVEAGMILRIDDEEILCTAVSGNQCTTAVRGWAGTSAAVHAENKPWMGSVHVQYHVSLYPGNHGCGTNIDCAFIDYLILNNHVYNFHNIYNNGSGTQIGSETYYGWKIPVPVYTPSDDRVFNQFQMDVPSGSATEVGEYVDQDNVTGSWGVLASGSCQVP